MKKRALILRKPGHCEFCYKTLPRDSEDTVCGACDKAMQKQYMEEDMAREERHAAKYKCQRCGKGLPLSRRFSCVKCLEEIEEMGAVELIRPKGSHEDYKPGLVTTANGVVKQCTDCLQQKDVKSFYRDLSTKDKLMYRCKECQKFRVKYGAANRKATLEQVAV